MDSPYRKELEVAISAVEEAARISQSVLVAAATTPGSPSSSLPYKQPRVQAHEKDDLSPVTVADFAIQALLTARVRAAFPDDTSFVGEEDAGALREDPQLLGRVWELLRSAAGKDEKIASREALCDLVDLAGRGTPSNGGSNGGGEGSSRRVWVFDPIDGTKTFVRGEMYAVNVALLVDGEQVLSVVACPLLAADHDLPRGDGGAVPSPLNNRSKDPSGLGAVLFAVRGYGAWVRPLVSNENPPVPRKLPRHADAVDSVAQLRWVSCVEFAASGIDDCHAAVAARLGHGRDAFPGSDLLGWVPRWTALAIGAANATVWVYRTRSYHAKIWDHAGAMLLFEEVGGKITDVDGRRIDLAAGRKLKGNFGFVAAPEKVHGEVLRAVRETLREQGKLELLRERGE
ncbi:hypothetical protein VTK73DRAFT_5632 [Phialemonium thermophilum]|uniref:3'(2'),5'-bisphosphate nucleotidase n=1 Tax=Phialemonium thermophilum TaxID=223376 RepID=A0ABR3WME4_9PEZI